MMVEAALSFQSALSILIIEVICLGVTNLLQKRETKKLQKEQESKKELGGENRKVIAGSGPRDFEQKIDEDDETDD